MKKILFENYETQISTACLISSFFNLFYNYKTTIRESDIFFGGNGLKLTFNWENDISLKNIQLFHDANAMLCNFFSLLGEELKITSVPECQNFKSYKEFIKEQIDMEKPIIIRIHTKHIPYYTIVPKTYRSHVITIIGYDDENAIISDCLVPTLKDFGTYLGPISFEELYKASAEREFIYYEFSIENVLRKINNNITGMIHVSFLKSLENFCENEVDKFKVLAERIGTLVENYSKEEIQLNAENLFFSIKYNGICYSRQLISRHFQDYYLKNKKSDIELKHNLNKIIKEWETINFSLLKNNMLVCKKEKYSLLKEYILQEIDFEVKVYEELVMRISEKEYSYSSN